MPGTKGRSGRKPKPTALKLIEGNAGKRKIDSANEMQPELGAPEPPAWLPAEALAEWDRIVPELEATGVLSKIDGAALAACCVCWARFVEAEDEIKENGIILVQIERELADGKILISRAIKNPAVQISHAAQAQYRAWCSEFGLSPSARTRVKVPGEGGAHGTGKDPARLLS
jgi:P27 family predicted phage terminase small subunit